MKILVIDQTAVTFQARKRWRMLAGYPDAEVCVLTPNRWVENYIVYRYEKVPDEPLTVYPGRVIFPGYENRGMFFLSIFQAFRKVKPDVVLLMEEPYSIFSLQAIVARMLFAPRARLIFNTWDNLTHHFNHIYKPRAAYRMIDRLTLAAADAALCANAEAAQVLESKGFNKPVQLIYTGIDLSTYRRWRAPAAEGTARGEFRIGYVGRMLEQKGIGILLRAFAGLPESARLILVGSGPYSGDADSLAGGLGIGGRVERRESLTPEDAAGYMRTFDVLVLPSLTTRTWKEQFGRVLVEGMASGCVIAGSDSGAIPEVIGDAGLITPEGNHESLREALLALMHDPALMDSLREKGYRRAEEFSLEVFVRKVYDVCRHCIGS